MKLKIKRITEWQYRPYENVGIFGLFGWRLVVVRFEYYVDGKRFRLPNDGGHG